MAWDLSQSLQEVQAFLRQEAPSRWDGPRLKGGKHPGKSPKTIRVPGEDWRKTIELSGETSMKPNLER